MAALADGLDGAGHRSGAAAAYAPPPLPRLVTRVFGLEFPHPSASRRLDKDGVAVSALESLGFGAVEVGTVTPRPQPGNRSRASSASRSTTPLINRMGLNNQGAEELLEQLSSARRPHPRPLGINLGKEQGHGARRGDRATTSPATGCSTRPATTSWSTSPAPPPGLRKPADRGHAGPLVAPCSRALAPVQAQAAVIKLAP